MQTRQRVLSLLFLALCVMFLGVLALAGEAGAEPPSQGTVPPPVVTAFTTASCSNVVTTTLTSPSTFVNAAVPPYPYALGAFERLEGSQNCQLQSPVSVTVPAGNAVVPAGNYNYRGDCHHLDLCLITGTLPVSVTISIKVHPEDLAAVGGDPSKLKILMYNPATRQWSGFSFSDLVFNPVTSMLSVKIGFLPENNVFGLFSPASGGSGGVGVVGGGLGGLLDDLAKWLDALVGRTP